MTVADNVAFGLEVLPRKERPSPTEIKTRVMHLLEMVQLEHLANRFPYSFLAVKNSVLLWRVLWQRNRKYYC